MLESFFVFLGLAIAPTHALPPLDLISITSAPQLSTPRRAPVGGSKSALVLDLASGKILFAKNAHERRPIASLTKLMTAVVARENFDLAEIVTVSENAARQPAAKIWLRASEQISVRDLLAATLIESGNDAAIALAEHAGDEPAFVAKMNAKAVALGLTDTHFANPVGYDDPENFGTAYDLAILAGYVLRDPVLREIAATQREVVLSTDGTVVHPLVSTNILFNSYLDIRGLKTGSTKDAGACLAAIARSADGREVLAIVLDSPNRFQETKGMLEWALSSHRW